MGGTYPSAMFTFAVLLHLGLPVAVLMQAVAVTVNGIAPRKSWHRVMFNIAQSTLALTAAAVVIGTFGHAPSPAVPWVPTGDALPAIALAGVAYFATRAGLVCGAVALPGMRSSARGSMPSSRRASSLR